MKPGSGIIGIDWWNEGQISGERLRELRQFARIISEEDNLIRWSVFQSPRGRRSRIVEDNFPQFSLLYLRG